jgi:uncharacterized RDD family membrane protein YckC
MERVGFGKRLVAALIDVAIVLVVGGGISALTGSATDATLSKMAADQHAATAGGVLAGAMVFTVIAFLYSLIEAIAARSPGGMILKIIIRNQDASPASPAVLFKRWAIKNSGSIIALVSLVPGLMFLHYLSTILGLIIAVGCFLVLRADRLTLHDILAKTSVYPQA